MKSERELGRESAEDAIERNTGQPGSCCLETLSAIGCFPLQSEEYKAGYEERIQEEIDDRDDD